MFGSENDHGLATLLNAVPGWATERRSDSEQDLLGIVRSEICSLPRCFRTEDRHRRIVWLEAEIYAQGLPRIRRRLL